MALSAGEYLSGGQVCDAQGRTVCISETAGAALSAGEFYSGGYLRDVDGRMVICQDTLNSALGAGEVYSGGDVRDSQGRVAVAVDTVNSALSGNEQISGGQVRDGLGRRVIAIDTLGAVLSAGEFFSGGNVVDKVGRTVIALESVAAPFDPATIGSGTVLGWWKADALALVNGNAVSSWPDSSAAGHTMTQATGGLQPTFNTAVINGLPAVTFVGASIQRVSTVAFALPAAWTLFAVARSTGGALPADIIGADQSGVLRIWQLRFNTAALECIAFNTIPTAFTATQPATVANFSVLSAINIANTSIQDRVNQVAGSAVTVTGTSGSGSLAITLGVTNPTAPTSPLTGQIAEALVFSGALNGTDVSTVENYLKAKYGL